jgi:hypothetical protein
MKETKVTDDTTLLTYFIRMESSSIVGYEHSEWKTLRFIIDKSQMISYDTHGLETASNYENGGATSL